MRSTFLRSGRWDSILIAQFYLFSFIVHKVNSQLITLSDHLPFNKKTRPFWRMNFLCFKLIFSSNGYSLKFQKLSNNRVSYLYLNNSVYLSNNRKSSWILSFFEAWTLFCKRFRPFILCSMNVSDRQTFLIVSWRAFLTLKSWQTVEKISLNVQEHSWNGYGLGTFTYTLQKWKRHRKITVKSSIFNYRTQSFVTLVHYESNMGHLTMIIFKLDYLSLGNLL